MPDATGYKRIEELLRSLTHRTQALEHGALGLEGLEEACDEARELYERLVVLRHKAREARIAPTGPDETAATPLHVVHEAPPIRLDTRPPDDRQTSLIDAIAETEKTPARRKEPGARTAATIGDQLGRAPVKDLGRAIAVSQRFWFINELFARDAAAYERTIKQLNASKDLEEARTRFQTGVLDKLKKPPGEDVVAAFKDLLERRFQ